MDKTNKHCFAIFTEKGDGVLDIYGDAFRINSPGVSVSSKISFITFLENAGALPLAKVSAVLKFYDYLGGQRSANFAIHDSDFLALKKIVGK